MQNEKVTGPEAWEIVAKRMGAAYRIASQCNAHTAMVYDRLVLEELRGRGDAQARAIRGVIDDLSKGGAL